MYVWKSDTAIASESVTAFSVVMPGLDPAIDFSSENEMDCRVMGERSDAVLRTAQPGIDEGSSKVCSFSGRHAAVHCGARSCRDNLIRTAVTV